MPSAKKVSKALGGNQTAQGFLGNLRGDVSKYDSVKATAPAGLIRKTKIGDVLQQRYYGDDFDAVVDAAQAAAKEGRPSHYHPDNMPKDAMQDEIVMLRPKKPGDMGDSWAFSVPGAGTAVNPSMARQQFSRTGSTEDLLRGIESHEIAHSIDSRKANAVEQSGNALVEFDGWEDDMPVLADRQDVKDDLMTRLGDQGYERVTYVAKYPELKANIAQHKRNVYAQEGLDGVPMTREDVTRMYDEMAENASLFDIEEQDMLTSDALLWDVYGDDPDALHGPSAGRQLRGAAETDMNLGNLWLHSNDEEKAMMVEDFLRSVDNFDIRKSLLARTA
jgi:hypothetical protein